jgi:putative hemolysin
VPGDQFLDLSLCARHNSRPLTDATKPPASQQLIQELDLPPTRPPLDERRGVYSLRFAQSDDEVERCLRLRYEVFNLELGEGLRDSKATQLDQDRFDAIWDHLMVIDGATDRVIGTYRMQTWAKAQATEGFYSAGEFDLSSIPVHMMQGAVELGRAAVAKEYRDQAVLFLLWRGLASYLYWNRSRYFFGCSSITSQDPEEGLRAYAWLKRNGHLHDQFEVTPLHEHACHVSTHQLYEGEYTMPKLFELYLRFGAKLCGPPAIDREFGTIDFLTWTDTRRIEAKKMAPFTRGLPLGEEPS